MLWHKYPDHLDNLTLLAAYEDLQGEPPGMIPWLVWLLENPVSPLSLPGSIDLFGHDCIHLLLKKGFRPVDEAYIVGFTMGNDVNTTRWHLLILKIAACYLYPDKYKFTYSQLKNFDLGVRDGKRTKIKNINKFDWTRWNSQKLSDLRIEFGLEIEARTIKSEAAVNFSRVSQFVPSSTGSVVV